MKRAFQVLGVTVLAAVTYAQTTPGRVEQSFAPGGHIKLELGGGDYEVRAGAPDKIVISYRTERPEQMKDVDARIGLGLHTAEVQVHGPRSNFHVVIELPARSDLNLR